MKFSVVFENTPNIESFKYLLERYKSYKSCLRDLKINSVLGKKSIFEIVDINPHIFCGFDNTVNLGINKCAFGILSLYFTLNDNLDVLNLLIEIEIYKTPMGEVLSKLIEVIEIHPIYESSNHILGFYAKSKEN